MPVHVAWVASGAERWAARHAAGPEDVTAATDAAVADLVEGALALGIRWLTLHVPTGPSGPTGTEPAPVAAGALARWPDRFGPAVAERGVAVRLLGGEGVAGPVTPVEADEPALVVNLAVGYSGRGEIVDAVRRLAAEGTRPSEVDEAAIGRSLYDPAMPDPDLVVRSGGDRRVSELLLWEVAYSELLFLDDPWPAVDRRHLYDAVVEYQRRDRRYGGLVATGEPS